MDVLRTFYGKFIESGRKSKERFIGDYIHYSQGHFRYKEKLIHSAIYNRYREFTSKVSQDEIKLQCSDDVCTPVLELNKLNIKRQCPKNVATITFAVIFPSFSS